MRKIERSTGRSTNNQEKIGKEKSIEVVESECVEENGMRGKRRKNVDRRRTTRRHDFPFSTVLRTARKYC